MDPQSTIRKNQQYNTNKYYFSSGMQKQLIFEEAEMQPIKVLLPLPSLFNELKLNRTALLTKNDLEKPVYL